MTQLKHLKGYKIYTTHGLVGLEKPIPGADHYACISKELLDLYPDIQNKSLIETGFNIKNILKSQKKGNFKLPDALVNVGNSK